MTCHETLLQEIVSLHRTRKLKVVVPIIPANYLEILNRISGSHRATDAVKGYSRLGAPNAPMPTEFLGNELKYESFHLDLSMLISR